MMIGLIMVVKVSGSSVSELESEKKENESEKEQVESKLEEMSESRNELENYLFNLQVELESVNTEISSIENKISEKESAIALNNELLNDAKEDESVQYVSMKKRIQFLYEAGNTDYYEIIFANGSISDNINKAEFMSELIKYDRDMLGKYQDTKDIIVGTEKILKKDMKELKLLKGDLEEKKGRIADKIASSSGEIRKLANKISEAEASKAEYEMIIMEKEQEIIRRREQESISESIRQSEEASRREAEKNNEETTEPPNDEPYVPLDEATEIELLSTIIYCEAGNQPEVGMYAVGSVVINRIKSPNFPNTMIEVLEQPYQFSPVTVSPRFYIALERKEATPACIKVATDILQNGVITGDWLFFRVNDGSKQGTVIGDHVFY
ncbi:MAG: cell wall hydrolase [Lachnospiraceae bacterium]|nr:cell wall hydrolase [Lachnospiraceae bacterium]